MATEDTALGPGEAREAAYALLALRSPKKVVVDTSLRDGDWYVVRAPWRHERERLEAPCSDST